MKWISKVPTPVLIAVIIVGGLLVLALIGGFVGLTMVGADTTDYRSFVNTLANLIMLPLMGLGTTAAVSAARSASNAEDNTNGKHTAELDDVARRAAAAAIRQQGGTA